MPNRLGKRCAPRASVVSTRSHGVPANEAAWAALNGGDTALDADGNLSGACTPCGTARTILGRVGDSSLIGTGLSVDNEAGAVCATGCSEAVIGTAGDRLAVEAM